MISETDDNEIFTKLSGVDFKLPLKSSIMFLVSQSIETDTVPCAKERPTMKGMSRLKQGHLSSQYHTMNVPLKRVNTYST